MAPKLREVKPEGKGGDEKCGEDRFVDRSGVVAGESAGEGVLQSEGKSGSVCKPLTARALARLWVSAFSPCVVKNRS